jgi:hypothetical protein
MLIFSDEVPTLEEILNSYQYIYMRDSPFGGINEFPELQIKLLTYSEGISPPSLLSAYHDNRIVAIYGFMYGNPPAYYYSYDFNGDGIFEYSASTQFFIPPWITYKISMPRNYPNNFFNSCHELYSMYNTNEGLNNQRLTEILNDIINVINTTTEYNRDIYYSFIQYFRYYDQYPEIALSIILALGDHIIYLTDENIPLLVLYAGEALIKTGNDDRAFAFFSALKNIDNNSIVAEYYMAMLNDKRDNAGRNMETFKNKYPSFWMIK